MSLEYIVKVITEVAAVLVAVGFLVYFLTRYL